MNASTNRLGFVILAMCAVAGSAVAADEPPPDPQTIIRQYIFTDEGKRPDVERGMALLEQWFQANRQLESYLGKLDYTGQMLVGAFRRIDDPSPAIAFFQRELSKTTDPKAIYIIHESLARLYGDHKDGAKAVEHWKIARRAMMGKDHPYFTTRQALPLMEIAKIYHSAGDTAKAIQYYEAFYATDYGQKDGGELCTRLGPLYEAQGEWKKAKELYEHFLAFPYYARDEAMRGLLPLAQKEDYDQANALARDLTNTSFAKRRQAFHAMRKLFDERGKPADWVRWLDTRLKNEQDVQAHTLLATLRQNVAPLEYLGADLAEPQPRLDSAARPTAFGLVGQSLIQAEEVKRFFGPLLDGAPAEMAEGKQPWRLSALCTNAAYHRAIEGAYAKVRSEILAGGMPASIRRFGRPEEPRHPPGTPPPVNAQPQPPPPALEEARGFLKDSPDLLTFLRSQIVQGSPDSAWGVMLLYTLGNPEDIPFLADHLPDTARLRGLWFWFLASALYREGAIDIPEALGLGDLPYVDWWNARVSGPVLRERLHRWWDGQKGKFQYDRNERSGATPLVFEDFMATHTVTTFAEAPELDGVFWLTEDHWLDSSAQIEFLDFATGRKTILVEGGNNELHSAALSWSSQGISDYITGLRWNAKDRSLEFSAGENQFTIQYANAKPIRIAASAPGRWIDKRSQLPTIQARGRYTYEVRAGDLYRVDEQSGADECLIRYGYVLGFAISQDGRQAVILDRDMPGPALWLVPLK